MRLEEREREREGDSVGTFLRMAERRAAPRERYGIPLRKSITREREKERERERERERESEREEGAFKKRYCAGIYI